MYFYELSGVPGIISFFNEKSPKARDIARLPLTLGTYLPPTHPPASMIRFDSIASFGLCDLV